MSMTPNKEVFPARASGKEAVPAGTPCKTHGGNEEGFLKNWLDTLHIIDAFTEKLCDNTFNNIKRHILDKIISAAGRNARLNGYDEKVYDYYKHLMEYYEAVAGLYEENSGSIVTPGIQRIIEGVYDVVSLQRKQFFESQEQAAENPVTREKKEIIVKSVTLFTTSFDVRRMDFLKQYLWEAITFGRQKLLVHFDYSEAEGITGFLTDMIRKNCCGFFHADYYTTVMLCYDQLNNLHGRKSTLYYYQLLEKERDILGSIIKVQVAALENEIDKPHISAAEKALVENILTILREGYQYYSREATEIMVGFHEAESANHNISIEDFEAFDASLKTFTAETGKQSFLTQLFDRCKTLYHEKVSIFKKGLREEAMKLFNISLLFSKSIYGFQKDINEQVLMSDEMIQTFQRLLDFFKGQDYPTAFLDTPEYAIMKGISETIEIKIESLQDNTTAFVEGCNENITHLADSVKDEMQILDEDMHTASEVLYEKWTDLYAGIHDQELSAADVRGFFEKSQTEDPFLSYKQRADRIQTRYQEKINKKVMAFKREHILFEVSTYEEINNYSVSRLMESEDATVSAFVNITTEVTEAIDIILKKNNIVIINPAPHDLFNGKEHEVLMAEKNQDFKKGEIIKLMNSGYKQQDLIILRANVIAAK